MGRGGPNSMFFRGSTLCIRGHTVSTWYMCPVFIISLSSSLRALTINSKLLILKSFSVTQNSSLSSRPVFPFSTFLIYQRNIQISMSKAKLIIYFLKPALFPASLIWVNDTAIRWVVIIRILRVLIYYTSLTFHSQFWIKPWQFIFQKYFLNLCTILP